MSTPRAAVKAGREALAKIDAVIAARPKKDDYVLSDATQALCAFRDGMLAKGGEGAVDRQRLETLNAVIAVVIGVHFPMAETPWDELVKARTWLAGLLPSV